MDKFTLGVFAGSGFIEATVRRDHAGAGGGDDDSRKLEIGATARLEHDVSVLYLHHP